MPEQTFAQHSNPPLVSIAMATYNAGRHLAPQLDSLLKQSYANIEIVVSDDGSDDGTYERLLEYAASEPRLRVLPRRQRLGFNANFMHCFGACGGQWISPCDQDDVWDHDKTRLLMDSVPPGGLAFCDSSFIDSEGKAIRYRGVERMSEKFVPDSDPPLLGLLMRSCVSGHAMIFPAELLHNMPDVPPHNYYDYWITLWARAQGRSIRYVDEPLVKYRRHDDAVVVQTYTPSKASQKIRTLQAQWAAAATLRDVLEPSTARQEVVDFLNALRNWLEKSFTPGAFRFFFTRRNELFRRERRGEKLKKAFRYLIGYGLRSRLRPRRYPRLITCEGAEVKFDLRETARS